MRKIVLAFVILLASALSAWAQRLIHVTDPTGIGIEINTSAITKLRPHKGGCIIYLFHSTQHVKESCAHVLEVIQSEGP